MRIKIVQFIHGFNLGGAENLVKQYSLLLDTKKIDLYVIAIKNFHSIHDIELKQAGIKVIYLDDIIDKKIKKFPLTLKKVMHRIYRKIIFKKCIKDISPDIIHYHLFVSDYIKYAIPSMNTKIILTVHYEPKRSWDGSKERSKDEKAVRWLLKNYDYRFIVLHDQMKEKIKEMFHTENISILNNGVLLEKFQNVKGKSDLKNELKIPTNSLVVGHVGRFDKVKNHEFLIKIFKSILDRHENSVLLLVGDGVMQDAIKKEAREMQISDKIIFLGERNDVPELLGLFDIMIFPSLHEGLSVALIEAQVAGVKCLISDTIAKETKISNILEFMDLNESPEKWAVKALEIAETNNKVECDYENWDMRKVVLQLQDIYEDMIND